MSLSKEVSEGFCNCEEYCCNIDELGRCCREQRLEYDYMCSECQIRLDKELDISFSAIPRNGEIRETYLAKLKQMREQFPEAHFEVITATARSPLAPSWELLKRCKRLAEKTGFERTVFREIYTPEFIDQITNSPKATKRLAELKEIAKEKDVYLVCYEKDPSLCHRSIIKAILAEEGGKKHFDLSRFRDWEFTGRC